MIIERKYVSFYELSIKDIKSKEIFEGTIKKAMSKEQAEHLINHHYTHRTMVYGATMDYCIPDFDKIINGFEELDKIYPYDNGLNITDVNQVDIVEIDKSSITLHLKYRFYDETYIVKVLKVNNE